MTCRIDRNANVVSVTGEMNSLFFLPILIACIHEVIDIRGYSGLDLDFSKCSAVAPSVMIALCAQVLGYRSKGTAFTLQKPLDLKLARLFDNVGWSSLIAPYDNRGPSYKGSSRVPATVFKTDDEQFSLVNTMMDALLASVRWPHREGLAAIEWAINEITDNVLVHSESSVGGLAQLTVFGRSHHVQLDVCDAGVSIPFNFGARGEEDYDILNRAIQEGVKGTHSIGKGNGLFGSFQICEKSGGEFHMYSRYGHLMLVRRRGGYPGVSSKNEKVPFNGTLVSVKIDCSKPDVLAEALKLDGKVYSPEVFIDFRYDGGDAVKFCVKNETKSFGSRLAGMPVKRKIENLIDLNPDKIILLDFDGISLVSSSFADEVLGKLYSQLGDEKYKKTIKLVNVGDLVGRLIQREIVQRKDIVAHP